MVCSPAATLAHAALGLASTLALARLPLGTAASPELARDKLCLVRHTVDRKVVGPALKDLAARHARQADAVQRRAAKVITGSAGALGPVPMAANPHVSPDEARRVAAWVLGPR